jgi:lipopolysaccharide transport system permease protein
MLRRLFSFAADLWTQRELLCQFTLRNMEVRHKGSHLGLIWSFLSPLLMLGLYVLVFGYIFGGSFGVRPTETRVDYALGIFLGLAIFQFVTEILGVSPFIIAGNPNFVKKVVFPLEILPAASVGAALSHMIISLGLVLIGLVIFGAGTSWSLCWLPAILLPVVLLMLGLSWFLSALGVFFRDIGQVIQFISMSLMFASGVFYSAQKIPAPVWVYMRFNPILLAIELARDAVLWNRPLNYHHLGYLYAISLIACWLGYGAFKRMKPAFADVL